VARDRDHRHPRAGCRRALRGRGRKRGIRTTRQRLSDIEIWTGAQTGVDRAGLDVAIELGLPYHGWIPKGRLAEDGPLSSTYHRLRETETSDGDERTRRNVEAAHATLFVIRGSVSGGTAFALATAQQLGRATFIVDVARDSIDRAAIAVRQWIESLPRPLRLNVAGPRESTTPGICETASEILRRALRDEA
jgi:hypothetical protein